MHNEIREHLVTKLIPFWKGLRDQEFGGYYGLVNYDLTVDKKAPKGCILNSRILWFFSNAYTLLQDETLLDEADHAYDFLINYCLDKENGGIFWSMQYNGEVEDFTKHTYNQAFAIYALASYYEASGKEDAILLAGNLMHLIETKCRDKYGYKEAFSRVFVEVSNEKLSENGILADKTMNTLLHVMEAYTELYRVNPTQEVKQLLSGILDTFIEKVYHAQRHRQEVFFDDKMNSLIDLHSYGHDIEAAWLLDRCVEVLGVEEYQEKISPITKDLTAQIYQVAFDGRSVANECENGVVNDHRIWWVQAEAIVGFLNGWMKSPLREEYLCAAKNIWDFIKSKLVDPREGSEWYWEVTPQGIPYERAIVEPWKCPYHNGRMCMEVIKRCCTSDTKKN